MDQTRTNYKLGRWVIVKIAFQFRLFIIVQKSARAIVKGYCVKRFGSSRSTSFTKNLVNNI